MVATVAHAVHERALAERNFQRAGLARRIR
jgi:hypothetical protein